MITITFYGLDQFVVGRLSRELTPLLSKLYEVEEDEINFIAPSAMVFHKGTEQTSWNILIRVDAPEKAALVQSQAADLLLKGIGEVAIHKTVEFNYYHTSSRIVHLDPTYPRYLTEENIVGVEGEEYEEMEEGEGEDQIYTGDIFANFGDK